MPASKSSTGLCFHPHHQRIDAIALLQTQDCRRLPLGSGCSWELGWLVLDFSVSLSDVRDEMPLSAHVLCSETYELVRRVNIFPGSRGRRVDRKIGIEVPISVVLVSTPWTRLPLRAASK